MTAISQILAPIGVGQSVPLVAPALWAGADGADAALDIAPVHLPWSLIAAALGSIRRQGDRTAAARNGPA